MEMHPPRACVSRTQHGWPRSNHRSANLRAGLAHWLTLLCLALVFLSGTIQAEHVHPAAPGSPDTHAACSLCVTAHVGFASTAPPLLHRVAKVIGQAEPRPADRIYAAPKFFHLYTRPPPTEPTLA